MGNKILFINILFPILLKYNSIWALNNLCTYVGHRIIYAGYAAYLQFFQDNLNFTCKVKSIFSHYFNLQCFMYTFYLYNSGKWILHWR